MNKESITDIMKDVKVFRVDEQNDLILVSYGGHGVNIYDHEGYLIAFYNMGNCKGDQPTEKEIIESMERHIKANDYDSYII
jgi:hypothetical protein